MNNRNKMQSYAIRQNGAVLIVALMLLIVLTMLGISAMESTKLETRMARNAREMNHAFQAAEFGVVQARLKYKTINSEIFKKLVIPEKTEFTNVVRDDKTKYNVEITVVSVPNRLPYKDKYLFVTSTGRSSEQNDAPEVVLEAGLGPTDLDIGGQDRSNYDPFD